MQVLLLKISSKNPLHSLHLGSEHVGKSLSIHDVAGGGGLADPGGGEPLLLQAGRLPFQRGDQLLPAAGPGPGVPDAAGNTHHKPRQD